MTPSLETHYLGLRLRSPLVPSASPLTGDLHTLHALESAGAAAVVLPSLFEEQITHESIEVTRMLDSVAGSHPEASGYFPELDDYNLGATRYLRHLERAKRTLRIPVIASLNGVGAGGWTRYARMIEDAGADALELNIYRIAADPAVSGRQIEREATDLVQAVRAAVTLPLAVKVGPFFTAFAHVAAQLVNAGADGLVLFNRFYQPDIDPETREVEPRLVLSSSNELRLPLRWIAILRGQLAASLAATTGIHSVEDVAKALLAGADVACLASALLQRGPAYLGELERELLLWMSEREYASVEQLKGSASRARSGDAPAFERANYLEALTTYSTRQVL